MPRLTVQGFGPDGDELRASAILDLALGDPVTATVRVGGPNGDVLRLAGVPVAVPGGSTGRFALDIRLPEAMNDTGMTRHELLGAMTHESGWRLSVSVADPASARHAPGTASSRGRAYGRARRTGHGANGRDPRQKTHRPGRCRDRDSPTAACRSGVT